MATTLPTRTRYQVGKGTFSETEMSPFGFEIPVAHRRQMELIAADRGWSLAETMRRAVLLFLRENRDLLQVLGSQNGHDHE